MKVKKIFLASSSELRADRDQFRIAVSDKSNLLADQGSDLSFRVVVWENFVDAMSLTRLQDEYNKAIGECDLFVMLYHSKVGKYTEEEFDTARRLFQDNGRPKVYTYCKTEPIDPSNTNERDRLSLEAFNNKLKTIGHFRTEYANFVALENHFKDQIDKLIVRGYFDDPEEEKEKELSPEELIDLIKSEVPRAKSLSKLAKKYKDQLAKFEYYDENEMISFMARCNQLDQEIRTGIITTENATIKRNQLNYSFLGLLDNIEP